MATRLTGATGRRCIPFQPGPRFHLPSILPSPVGPKGPDHPSENRLAPFLQIRPEPSIAPTWATLRPPPPSCRDPPAVQRRAIPSSVHPDRWSRPDSPGAIPHQGACEKSARVEFVPAERRPLPARFCSHERRRIKSIILSSSYAGLRRGVALREPSNKPPITCLNHTRRQTLLTTMPTIGDTPPTSHTLCANTAIVSLTRWACQRSQTHFLGEPTDRDPRAWQDCYSKVGFCVRGAPPTFSCQTPSDPVSGA